jgi:excisionase family DNA binding protein
MKDVPIQLDMRENSASSRWHASRAGTNDSFRRSDPLCSTDSSDKTMQALQSPINETFELSLTEPGKEATGGKDGVAKAAERLLRQGNRPSVERPLTCEEAAAFVRVHPKTVKRMARSGDLPGHFRFGRWFFYASELDCWMRTELHSSRHSCRRT